MSRNSAEDASATMVVFSVIKNVFPVAFDEIGLGITRSKAIFASGDVDLESLHAETRKIRAMKAAQL